MELIPHNLNLNFVKYRRFFVIGSIVVNVLILLGLAVGSLNYGVDFKGGSEIEVKFKDRARDVEVRKTIQAAGFEDASAQVIGPAEENSFLIRVGRVSFLTDAATAKAKNAFAQKFGPNLLSFDFNSDYGDKIELRFQNSPEPEEIRSAMEAAGVRVLAGAEGIRKVHDGYTVVAAGISNKVESALQSAYEKKLLPSAELRRVEFVGPQVGKQLRTKGIKAVIFAAIAILFYIAIRFDTRFAPGAVLAMCHDIVVVLGYYLVSGREFNLTSVAVLLTVVGYSVNDTIVIYDRIRENMAKMKGMGLIELVNRSLNETLGRTILTSLATALSLVGLLFFSVGQIWDFAAAMMLGIVTGTYSSIYIASPATIWLEEITGKSKKISSAVAKARAG
jgi:preprotein translocase subunit SecF